ncbi:MAG: MBL fold metallo-hydrolase [Bacillota bacterium]
MMEIKVLASGSKGNCYTVDDGHTKLIMEAGIPFRELQRGVNFGLAQIAGCLCSHSHADHSKSVADVAKAGVDTYLSQGTIDALKLSGHRIKPLRAMEQLRIGTWTILPFDAIHDVAEPLGFLLASTSGEKLVFATDTAYIKYRFNGLTQIMIEVNYEDAILRSNVEKGIVPAELRRRLMKTHMSLETAKGFFKANDLSRVNEIYLLHLSDNNSDAARFKREIQQVTGKPVYIA